MLPYLEKYAGEPLTTGAQAEAYADHFIFYHLQEIGGGQTYAQLSADALALPPGTLLYRRRSQGADRFPGHDPARDAPQCLRLVEDGPDRPDQCHRRLHRRRHSVGAVGPGPTPLPQGPADRGDTRLVPADQVITTKSPSGPRSPPNQQTSASDLRTMGPGSGRQIPGRAQARRSAPLT